MLLDKHMSTKDVSTVFENQFPYLSLRFYTTPHDHHRGSSKRDEVTDAPTLESLNPYLESGDIPMLAKMTVDNFETMMEKKFGLHVQVFRKSGGQWLQTTVTDHWTLEHQNKVGSEDQATSK